MGEKYNPSDLLKQNRQDRVNPYKAEGELKHVGEIYGKMISLMNDNFNKGKIDEALCEKGFKQLDMLIEKAGHKYLRREGTPGNYKYIYDDNESGGKSSERSVDELVAIGHKYKKELEQAKKDGKEYVVASLEEKLRRLSTVIRNKRAEEYGKKSGEKEFKAGEKYKWHGKEWDPKAKDYKSVVKDVTIKEVKPNGDVVGQFAGTTMYDAKIIRDPEETLKNASGLKEPTISEEYNGAINQLKDKKARIDRRAEKTHSYAEGKKLLAESDKLKKQIAKLENERDNA